MASTTWIWSRAEITPPTFVRYTLNVWHEMVAPLRKDVVVDEGRSVRLEPLTLTVPDWRGGSLES